MHSTTSLLSLLTFIAAGAAATSHDVLVGNAGFAYSPNSLTAAKDDTVVFHFYPGHHNVVQSSFNSPCSTSGGFYSGFVDSQSGPASETFTITINDTNPIWIYCSAPGHCQSGMAMVINPPTSGDSLTTYVAAAGKTSTSTTPGSVGGGVLSSGSGSGSSSSSSAASSASSSSASAASSSAASAASSSSATSASAASSSASQTSASPSATKNAASVVGQDVMSSGLTAIVAVVAFWLGLL